jgi:hypothetical protein
VDTPHGQCYVVFMRPRGTDRSAVDAFLARHPDLARADNPAPSLSAFLSSLDIAPLARANVAQRLEECGIANDPEALVADLIAAGGARWDGGTLRCGAAVDTVSRWEPYWERFGPIGEEVVARLGDGAADLRRRVARCSFSGCNFADAVTACVMLVRGAIASEVCRRGLGTVPPAADLSWGYFLVRAPRA